MSSYLNLSVANDVCALYQYLADLSAKGRSLPSLLGRFVFHPSGESVARLFDYPREEGAAFVLQHPLKKEIQRGDVTYEKITLFYLYRGFIQVALITRAKSRRDEIETLTLAQYLEKVSQTFSIAVIDTATGELVSADDFRGH
jgi:hypothetical protein